MSILLLYNAHSVSTRLEKELGKEQYMFVKGCPYEWGKLPMPDTSLTVGIDGGYIHAREGKNRKAGWFEAIVGKSVQEDKEAKRFSFVVDYDRKPKRRLYEVLKNQGLQMNQAITFLSDGGDTVRDLQLYLSPNSEHVLDWFHITMKITVMKQLAKNMKNSDIQADKELDRAKWYLWHGNVHKALKVLEGFNCDLEIYCDQENSNGYKLWKATEEFYNYIKNNGNFIPNYGERYRYGEAISTAFAESTVNEVISKRMVKKQQMRWTKKGAHLLLQLRVKTLNNELRQAFCKWYPKMERESIAVPLAA